MNNDKNKIIYLDNAATTKPDTACSSFIEECLSRYWANPSSAHFNGKLVSNHIHDLTDKVMKKTKIAEGGLYFMPSATLANNAVIQGHCAKYKKPKIISAYFEHPSVLETVLKQNNAEKEFVDFAFLYKRIQENKTAVQIENQMVSAYTDKVDDTVSFVSLMWVNNETGLVLPIVKIAEAVKKKNSKVHIHVDAVQGFMKLPLPEHLTDFIDSLSISAHKFHAVKGSAILWLKDSKSIQPIIFGGGQQGGLFPSTENTMSIIVMLEIILTYFAADSGIVHDHADNQLSKRFMHVKSLMKVLENLLRGKVISLWRDDLFSPFITKVYTDRLPSEPLFNLLNDKGYCVSFGSACSAKQVKKYNDTQKFGIPEGHQKGGIRISLSWENIHEEINGFAEEYLKILDEHGF